METSSNHGRRVVTGQRLVQAAGDIFLGWHRVHDEAGHWRDYYVRELRDWLPEVGVDWMAPPRMGVYGELCGWTLAHGHARSGDRLALAAYLGDDAEFEMTFADFAEAYADQNLLDYQHFRGPPDGREGTLGPSSGAAEDRAPLLAERAHPLGDVLGAQQDRLAGALTLESAPRGGPASPR